MLKLRDFLKENDIRLLFDITLILKGLHALIEIIFGISLYFITKDFVVRFVISITQGELLEDPKDFIVHFLIKSAEQLSISSQHFAALYLLTHGIIKGVLVIQLFRKKLWSYTVSVVVFGLFIIYQLYRFAHTHSVWLIIFTIFDVIVIWLIAHEYRYVKYHIRKTEK